MGKLPCPGSGGLCCSLRYAPFDFAQGRPVRLRSGQAPFDSAQGRFSTRGNMCTVMRHMRLKVNHEPKKYCVVWVVIPRATRAGRC
jgi:hypothetical protein